MGPDARADQVQAIRDYILREFLPGEDPAELAGDTPLISTGILDSVATLKLVTFLEERFGITIEAHEAGNVKHMNTVDNIITLLRAKMEGGAA